MTQNENQNEIPVEPIDTSYINADVELRVRGRRAEVLQLVNIMSRGLETHPPTPGWNAAGLITSGMLEELDELVDWEEVHAVPDGWEDMSADDARHCLDVDLIELEADAECINCGWRGPWSETSGSTQGTACPDCGIASIHEADDD